MDDTQRIVKCGNLSLHTPGSFFKKRWHTKYLVLYDGSKSGVKRLELFESEIKFKKQSAVKIIPLVDCVRIVTCQRHKSTFTFEVRTSDQFYLLASKSFQDMNDWVNCLRFVAFGQAQAGGGGQTTGANVVVAATTTSGPVAQAQPPAAPSLSCSNGSATTQAACLSAASAALNKRLGQPAAGTNRDGRNQIDVLLAGRSLEARPAQQVSALCNGAAGADATPKRLLMGRVSSQPDLQQQQQQQQQQQVQVSTASQAAAAAASALAKARQRQPSLLGSCKPQPPNDSPFIKEPQEEPLGSLVASTRLPAASPLSNLRGAAEAALDTLTPTVRGQLIGAQSGKPAPISGSSPNVGQRAAAASSQPAATKALKIEATLDEEEENMLYCSIEDNPSEHNYRVKVIETELAVRCQLKCYQLTAPKTISQQYEELSRFRGGAGGALLATSLQQREQQDQLTPLVTFYQLIIGPQELTLLNDYAATSHSAHKSKQQQGLWSWPYQCIRRYGFDKDNCFMFEAGRKCGSGPGQFIVQTPKAYNIYQDIVKFVNELRTINALPPASSTAACVQSPVITQIPVTWAPNNCPPPAASSNLHATLPQAADGQLAEAAGAAERRKQQEQFFSQLSNQVDASATSQHQQQAGANCHSNVRTQLQQGQCAAGQDAGHDLRRNALANNQQLDGTHSHLASSRAVAGVASFSSNHQKVDHKGSLSPSSSRLSSASEETDESGYDQGDESVESGPTKSLSSQAPVDNEAAKNAPSRLAAGRPTGKLRVQPDSCSSSSSAASAPNSSSSSLSPSSQSASSAASSAANSPGQSVSRRTGETIQLEADRQQSANQLLIDARLSLNKVCDPAAAGPKTRATRNIIAQTTDQQRPLDFEASLIRDVYSEITKLHAKFAVTSTGSNGDDSLSDHSREGSAAVSDRHSANNQDDVDESDEEGSNCADDGCYYMNEDPVSDDQDEPMYSNLSRVQPRPSHRLGALSPSHQQQARRQHQQPSAISSPDKRAQLSSNLVAPVDQQSQLGHRTQQQNSLNAGRPVNYNPPPPLSPQSLRPIYPTILNPIPEISEPSQSVRHHVSKANEPAMDSKLTSDQSRVGNISARARLAVDRDAIKRQHYRPSAGTSNGQSNNTRSQRSGADTPKPTNHYVINDVQYAKISRSSPASRFR